MTTSVKVSNRYQIAVPQSARKKLNIRKGDRLLVDVQDGVIVLVPQPKRYSEHLAGLHKAVWENVDAQEYIDGERKAWASASGRQTARRFQHHACGCAATGSKPPSWCKGLPD